MLLVLLGAFATKEQPHTAVWITAVGVVVLRFLFVAFKATGQGPT
ncbi:hypothetical protein [Polymorphospora rubra]